MAEEKKEVPKGAFQSLTVPLDREKTAFATFHLKDLTEDVYMYLMTLIDEQKSNVAAKTFVKTLWIGGDDPGILENNLVALLATRKIMYTLMTPLDGELKKN
jgi:hypothetical protein